MGSFSIWHWLIVLLIVVMVFGTKKLKNIGSPTRARCRSKSSRCSPGPTWVRMTSSASRTSMAAERSAACSNRRRACMS